MTKPQIISSSRFVHQPIAAVKYGPKDREHGEHIALPKRSASHPAGTCMIT